MIKNVFPFTLFAASLPVFANTVENENRNSNIEEVVVQAEFFQNSLLKTSSSVTVLSEAVLEARNATHIEDVLNIAPNINFSAGASRGRFFQIRGIGERSQFVEPVNSSVGLVIDDIDFTGLGGAATTLDIQQVDILRGPQGTLMGANALAGIIHLKSADPSDEFSGNLKLGIGNYNSYRGSAVVSSPLGTSAGIRLAVEKNTSDGFIHNTYLNRKDTNNIDELTSRLKAFWNVTEAWQLKFSAHNLETDNGYDAFSLDNTRETLSDEPGKDTQSTSALSLSSNLQTSLGFDWKVSLSQVDADMEYSYDEDWAYADICEGLTCSGWEYSSFDQYLRDHTNTTIDTRLVSEKDEVEWVLGLYHRDTEQKLQRVWTYATEDFFSDYEISSTAIYGQIGVELGADFKLVGGLRFENFETDYFDNQTQQLQNDESFTSGRLILEYTGLRQGLAYALISTGYKAGGYNTSPKIPDFYRRFNSEEMVNYELGFKQQWLDGRLQTLASVFYQDRKNIQTRQNYVTSQATGKEADPCPCDFVGYLNNSAKGINYGLETEIIYYPIERLQLWLNAGLLDAEFKGFKSLTHEEADPSSGVAYDMEGRAQPHASALQLASGISFELTSNVVWGFDVEHKGEFYFSASHNKKTEAYTLYNSRLQIDLNKLNLSLWIKNITNEVTWTRGFSFGNDPRDSYESKTYFQFGAPRTFGLTALVQLPN